MYGTELCLDLLKFFTNTRIFSEEDLECFRWVLMEKDGEVWVTLDVVQKVTYCSIKQIKSLIKQYQFKTTTIAFPINEEQDEEEECLAANLLPALKVYGRLRASGIHCSFKKAQEIFERQLLDKD